MFKILHVLDGFGVGGAEKWLVSLTRYSNHTDSELKHDFLCTGGQKRILDNEIIQNGGKIYYVKYSSKSLIQFRSSVVPILKSGRYSLIWNHSDYIAGFQYLSVKDYLPQLRLTYLHNPLIQTRFYRTSTLRNLVFHMGKYLTYLMSTHTSGTSDAVMNEYGYNRWPFTTKRIAPIHCAFDPSVYKFNSLIREQIRGGLGLNEQHTVVLFVGRLSLEPNNPFPNQKNPGFAFELAKRIASQNKNFCFLFIGDKGHVGDEMEKEISTMGLQTQIQFLGVKPDVAPFYFASDLMIFPSLYEGLGMVAVEAQSANLPVLVSTAVPEEALVDLDLVKRLDLEIGNWMDAIFSSKRNPDRTGINQKVFNSGYNISNCEQRITLFLSESLHNEQS